MWPAQKRRALAKWHLCHTDLEGAFAPGMCPRVWRSWGVPWVVPLTCCHCRSLHEGPGGELGLFWAPFPISPCGECVRLLKQKAPCRKSNKRSPQSGHLPLVLPPASLRGPVPGTERSLAGFRTAPRGSEEAASSGLGAGRIPTWLRHGLGGVRELPSGLLGGPATDPEPQAKQLGRQVLGSPCGLRGPGALSLGEALPACWTGDGSLQRLASSPSSLARLPALFSPRPQQGHSRTFH